MQVIECSQYGTGAIVVSDGPAVAILVADEVRRVGQDEVNALGGDSLEYFGAISVDDAVFHVRLSFALFLNAKRRAARQAGRSPQGKRGTRERREWSGHPVDGPDSAANVAERLENNWESRARSDQYGIAGRRDVVLIGVVCGWSGCRTMGSHIDYHARRLQVWPTQLRLTLLRRKSFKKLRS
jgi:hypothetical protein